MKTPNEVIETICKYKFEVLIENFESSKQAFMLFVLVIPHEFFDIIVKFPLVSSQEVLIDESAFVGN
jgi:hypothetical protein